MKKADLKLLLDEKAILFNDRSFIESDPISVPKKFTKQQDIEIIALWTAILSWGQRKTIINSANRLVSLMEGQPFDFIMNHGEEDKKSFLKFVHRTFQPTDALYFLHFFRNYFIDNTSLEDAFYISDEVPAPVQRGLIQFQNIFFDSEYAPQRTRKHIASPLRNSSCKRLNMFLRWMVRDDGIVDFGLWKKLQKKDLYIPLDIHVQRVATKLGLLKRKSADWKAVVELTDNLKKCDASDPIKYDYALFGMGILQYDEHKKGR